MIVLDRCNAVASKMSKQVWGGGGLGRSEEEAYVAEEGAPAA
jgi:hypothetical protein